MKQDKVWWYWNDLPTKIPEDISVLTDVQKNHFLDKWAEAVWTKSSQTKEDKLISVRKLPTIKITVPEWVMDRVKETANHFVNGEWLSSIAISATISEFLSYYLLEGYINKNGIDELIQQTKKLRDQSGRLKLLKDLNVLSEENWKSLEKVREIRNKYLHLNRIDFTGSEIEDDCLASVKNLIDFLNKDELFINTG